MKEKLREKSWYPHVGTACVAVTLYVALTNLSDIIAALKTFLGYFDALFIGGVIAYLLNPLAKFYQRVLFKKIAKERLRWLSSVTLAVVTLLLFLAFLLGTVVPQLIDSISTLVNNMDGYLESLKELAERWGIAESLKMEQYFGPSGNIVNKLVTWLRDNAENILNASAAAGKGVVRWVVALILSVYLLASKDAVKSGALRLLRAIMPEKRSEKTISFFTRCDKILMQYILFSLLDALIVGVANAIIMTCLGMEFIGLVTLVVAVTNLIPTFGPMIGYVIGGLILLLVNPVHALIFVGYSLCLQFLDGYVIKPVLFGDSLGVSGLLILAAIIVFGNMFGILGILLSIPIAAILDFVYEEALLPALERIPKS